MHSFLYGSFLVALCYEAQLDTAKSLSRHYRRFDDGLRLVLHKVTTHDEKA